MAVASIFLLFAVSTASAQSLPTRVPSLVPPELDEKFPPEPAIIYQPIGKLTAKWQYVNINIDHAVMLEVMNNTARRTPAELKMESGLIEIKHQVAIDGSIDANQLKALSKIRLQNGGGSNPSKARVDRLGRMYVYVGVRQGVDVAGIVRQIAAIGGDADVSSPRFRTMQAWVLPQDFDTVVSLPGVMNLRMVVDPISHTGPVLSQGVSRLRADVDHQLLNATGAGVNVGVMGDDCGTTEGYFATDIANGELNANAISFNDSFTGTRRHEGLAMSEVVQDVAPNANIVFATAKNGATKFALSIDSLARPTATGGAACSVICDDVSYDDEPVFEDGELTTEIEYAAANYDAVYISAAGNEAKRSYFGTYKNIAVTTGLFAGDDCMDFGNGNIYYQMFIGPNSTGTFTLHWDDPFASPTNIYDLWLVDDNNTKVGFATHSPTAFDRVVYFNGAAISRYYYLVIQRTSVSLTDPNPNARLKLTEYGSVGSFTTFNPTSSIFGHSSAASCISAGAIAAGVNYNTIRSTSCLGPCLTVAYPARTSTSRMKPDIACFDSVATAAPNFGLFTGTSASSPHIAGVAALLRQKMPTLNAAQCRDALRAGCIDEGIPGADNTYGSGRLDAFKTLTLAMSGTNNTYSAYMPANAPIPDGARSVSSTISTFPICPGNAVDSIYVSMTVDGHNKYGDLIATLVAPDASTRIVLNRAPNGTGASLGKNPNVVLGDAAATSIESYDPGANDVLGFFAPASALSSAAGFKGKTIAGNWTLQLQDAASGNAGTLKEWGLYFKIDPTTSECLNLASDQPFIWSASHALKLVNFSTTVNGGSAPTVKLVSMTSNEPEAGTSPDDIPGDIVQNTQTQFQLRAECKPLSNGRLYTATYNLSDIGGFSQNYSIILPVACTLDHLVSTPPVAPPNVTLSPPNFNPVVTNTAISYNLPASVRSI